MRILFVNSATPTMWGGGEKWFTEAATWMRDRGHDVHVIARPDSRQLLAVQRREIQAQAFEFGGDYDPFASWRAGKILSRLRPDVLLVNFNKDAWLFGRGARFLRIPIVARHGLTLFKQKFVHRLVYDLHMDRVVVNAASIREEYAAMGFDVRKIAVILNGVKDATARPGALRAHLGIDARTPLVISAGRLDPQKRHDRFVNIAQRLSREFPEAHFAILGDGPRWDEIQTLARDSGLGDRLHLPGFVDDYASVASDADLFLLTSRNEGTPNVLLETMAAGVASLAFSVGAVPQMLEGIEEAIVPAGDVDEMANRAAMLLSDEPLRSTIAHALTDRCHARFSFERSMSEYEILFSSLV